jgi:2-keto-4-pentenoate hydratase/2-oxohepta-3-ene-1,7-dioic acid hydratase in catechol pathway
VTRFAHLRGRGDPLALVVGDQVAPLAPQLDGIATLDELIAAGPAAWRRAEEAAAAALADARPLEPGMLAAPLARPGKLACVGLNYLDHCRETGLAAPERPLIFAKFDTALAGPDETVAWSSAVSAQVDWEAELAVVVGAELRDASEDEALAAVFGYTAANDVSARDLQFADQQWVRGKSLDGFCPLGPTLVTADEFGDPQSKWLRCRVNGVIKQDSSTAEMIFGVARILSFLSRTSTLRPGDVVLTGTPWGCGGFASPPEFLADGDVVEVEVEGIGVLRTSVRVDHPITVTKERT